MGAVPSGEPLLPRMSPGDTTVVRLGSLSSCRASLTTRHREAPLAVASPSCPGVQSGGPVAACADESAV